MPHINVLPGEIFNRIAAGEVIENPSSVVKELVENSVDAGSTEILIAVERGGKYIKITDNGGGIQPEDLPVAFMPHATSKISSIADLDEIKTLGFRGEALPSIASVAKVTAISRTVAAELGAKIVIENGKVIDNCETGAPLGTTIIVEDLFKNVPARLKFLKSDRTEEGNISAFIGKFIIANYNVSISLQINGVQIFRSSGKGVQEAIFAVYGSGFLKEMSYIESIMPDIELYGYVNKPSYSKHNRTYQTLVINGRYVINSDISFWVYNCFSSVLMKRQYPAYVIYIKLPYDMVDINVHPNKMDVKFVNFDRIRRLLSSAIGEVLSIDSRIPKSFEITVSPGAEEVTPPRKPSLFGDVTPSRSSSFINFMRLEEPVAADTVKLVNNTYNELASTVLTNEAFHGILPSYKSVGKLFNTYLMLEQGDEILMIDQHAAHEKILFDKFSKAIDDGKNSSQNLLVPYIFDLSASEAALFDAVITDIEALGFSIARLSGNSYSMSGVPLVFSDINMGEFVQQLVKALSTGKLNKSDFIKNTVAQTACKAAVKGETDLHEADIRRLVSEIAESEIQLFCPHGRPIAIRISRNDIEKWFKRIV